MRTRLWISLCLIVAVVGLALFAASCGGSSKAHLRLVNAIPNQTSLDMLVDGSNVASSIGYATASGYVSVNSGSRHVQIEPTGASSPIIDTNTSLSSGAFTTALAYLNTSNANSYVALTDNNSAPSSGNFNLRVIDASPAMGASVDVYVLAPGSSPSGSPTFANVSEGSASSYGSFSASSSWQVDFTIPGTTTVLFSTQTLPYASGQVGTVVGLNAQAGGFTAAILTD